MAKDDIFKSKKEVDDGKKQEETGKKSEDVLNGVSKKYVGKVKPEAN